MQHRIVCPSDSFAIWKCVMSAYSLLHSCSHSYIASMLTKLYWNGYGDKRWNKKKHKTAFLLEHQNVIRNFYISPLAVAYHRNIRNFDELTLGQPVCTESIFIWCVTGECWLVKSSMIRSQCMDYPSALSKWQRCPICHGMQAYQCDTPQT